MKIKQLLNRRSDLGSFVVHLTREYEGALPKDNLINILKCNKIEARTMLGAAVSFLTSKTVSLDSQKCVCFSEVPLEHLYTLFESIEERQINFAEYGIMLTKKIARNSGVNPVWYTDITPGHDWLIEKITNLMNKSFDSTINNFNDSDLASILPFIETMGSSGPLMKYYKKEFWWEREWRYNGDFTLPIHFIGLCPEMEIKEFESLTKTDYRVIRFIDPKWSLEKIIAILAGFQSYNIDII